VEDRVVLEQYLTDFSGTGLYLILTYVIFVTLFFSSALNQVIYAKFIGAFASFLVIIKCICYCII
jgi:hypothetical protein